MSDEGDGQLEKELRELGIDIGDDNFQSAGDLAFSLSPSFGFKKKNGQILSFC